MSCEKEPNYHNRGPDGGKIRVAVKVLETLVRNTQIKSLGKEGEEGKAHDGSEGN